MFAVENGLDTNDRLCYPYGIWKSAKRKLRWISGVKKTPEDRRRRMKKKPESSIAGVGHELVGILNVVMKTLKEKDIAGQERGEPKKCWFIIAIEEVVQPLRFHALGLKSNEKSVDTVDFESMYTKFEHGLLKDRLHEAVP